MAKNTLVSQDALEALAVQLSAPNFNRGKDSDLGHFSSFSFLRTSANLQEVVEKKCVENPLWRISRPVVLGSWARAELCPKSDLDVLFLGPQNEVAQFVAELQIDGIKLRSRWVEKPDEFLEGIEAFDILNLLQAKAVFPEEQKTVYEFQSKVLKSKLWRRRIIGAVLRDRKKRAAQFDSLSNLLEPHLKSSAGGLRDIEQVFQVHALCSELFLDQESNYAFQVLDYAKKLFLQLRWELHLQGLDDHLVSTAQMDIAKKYGFSKTQDFMREVSRSFARAHFYSDWFFEKIGRKEADIQKVQKSSFKKASDALRLLKKDPSVLMQVKIRISMDKIFKGIRDKVRGQLLREVILPKTSIEVTQAIFRSRILDHLLPQIRPLIGYVQHDQYHRWTADRHLMQACIGVKEVFANPKLLLGLKKWHSQLTTKDWEILAWTSIYHDLAKGKSGDHSDLGEKYVREDLKKFGLKEELIEEVSFLVRHHLALSTAAFRKNPQAEATWKDFWQLGMTGGRVKRLALFTVIDIRATHPQAWNSWKAQLLADCVDQLLTPEKAEYLRLREKARQIFGDELGQSLTVNLDTQALRSFSTKTLLRDLSELGSSSQKNPYKLLIDRKGRPWVRFFQKPDELGLFEKYVRVLFDAGINIEQALIQTLPGFGVYDLFQFSKRNLKNFKRLRLQEGTVATVPPKVILQEIEIVSATEQEIVLSFRGTDARGLLWAIAHQLKQHSVFVIKARVHTWGGQVEDLIHVRPRADLSAVVQEMRIFFIG